MDINLMKFYWKVEVILQQSAQRFFLTLRVANTKFAKLIIDKALRTLCFYKFMHIKKLCALCGKILNYNKHYHSITIG
ncbi:hypothetical protein EAH81_11285 [Flavobacterium pectinovorum]|uniref:Uncharacterized protein n=1 Tax=Flavobacterium pectinovorum TaxID=29533 RepID=A0A502EWV8_9FLAO|nr:hypothetical protein EAH81_11285 [Flavobacterium pectinovorum]